MIYYLTEFGNNAKLTVILETNSEHFCTNIVLFVLFLTCGISHNKQQDITQDITTTRTMLWPSEPVPENDHALFLDF